jgi:hypothetical protein
MITPEQVTEITDRFARILKEKSGLNLHKDILPMLGAQSKVETLSQDAIAEIPEMWPGYRFSVKQLRDILSHAQRDVFPEHLFLDMGPHAKPRDIKFARLNFKAITLPVWMDFFNTILRAFQDGNWAIDYGEQDEYKEYVEKLLPIYGDLESYVKNVLTDIKLKDANGIVAIKPYEVKYVVDENGQVILDEEGFATISDELLDPYPVYYSCKNIIAQFEGRFFAVVSPEKSIVQVGGKPVREGIIIEIYDNEKILRVEQIGKKNDYTFGQPFIYFQHNLNYIPAFKLKGVAVMNTEAIDTVGLLYASRFSYAVDNLDRVLTDDATLEIVKRKCAFPYMVAVGNPCEFEMNGSRCTGGKIHDKEAGKEIVCPHCNGAGITNRLSPSGELLINPGGGSLTDMGDTKLQGKYIEFVAPDTAIFEFLEQQKKDNENRARRIIHIKDTDGKYVYNADASATASDNDMKAMHAFILPESDQIFELYEKIANAIGDMRFGDRFTPISIQRPQSFDMATAADYLDMIKDLVEIGVAPTIIREFMLKYLNSIFYSDKDAIKALEIIMAADKLLPFTNEVIATKVERGVAEKWQEVLHDRASVLIKMLEGTVPRYFDMDIAEQVRLLEEAAKAETPTGANGDDLATRLLGGIGA